MVAKEVPIPLVGQPVETVRKVRSTLEEEQIIQLSELASRLSANKENLHLAVMKLVENGEAAIFPVGDTVQIRHE